MTDAELLSEMRRRVRSFVDGETTAEALWNALGEELAAVLGAIDPALEALDLATCTYLADLRDG